MINREAVEPHQVGGPCRRCRVATSEHHLSTSEMSRSPENLTFSEAACEAEIGCLVLFMLPCFFRKASRANQRSELFLWHNYGNSSSCRAGGGGKTERCWTDEGGEMEGSKRSEALTHSDPSPCFTSSIVGIYTLA